MGAPDEDSEPCQASNLYYPSDRLATGLALDAASTPQTSEPYLILDMNFEHHDASKLATLSRIAAFHDDAANCIRGFEFHYTDGRREAFGTTDITNTAAKRWACVEQTVAVDGRGGERIVEVYYEHLYYELPVKGSISLVSGIKVSFPACVGRFWQPGFARRRLLTAFQR
jgi:hypothetical protein